MISFARRDRRVVLEAASPDDWEQATRDCRRDPAVALLLRPTALQAGLVAASAAIMAAAPAAGIEPSFGAICLMSIPAFAGARLWGAHPIRRAPDHVRRIEHAKSIDRNLLGAVGVTLRDAVAMAAEGRDLPGLEVIASEDGLRIDLIPREIDRTSALASRIDGLRSNAARLEQEVPSLADSADWIVLTGDRLDRLRELADRADRDAASSIDEVRRSGKARSEDVARQADEWMAAAGRLRDAALADAEAESADHYTVLSQIGKDR